MKDLLSCVHPVYLPIDTEDWRRPQYPIKRRHRAVVTDKRLKRHGGAAGIGQHDQPIPPNLAQRQANHAGRFIVREMRRHQVDLNAHIHAALERGDGRSPARAIVSSYASTILNEIPIGVRLTSSATVVKVLRSVTVPPLV